MVVRYQIFNQISHISSMFFSMKREVNVLG